MTQCDRILRHLEDAGSITQAEAMSEYGIMRLAARIADLRGRGDRHLPEDGDQQEPIRRARELRQIFQGGNMNAMTKAALAQRRGMTVAQWDAVDEYDEVPEASLEDTVAWMLDIVHRLNGDRWDKEVLENLLEELQELADRERRADLSERHKYSAATCLRNMTDLYEAEVLEHKKEMW